MYTVHLGILGMIRNSTCIADIFSIETKKGRAISDPAYCIFLTMVP
jgi:hypothetical protein